MRKGMFVVGTRPEAIKLAPVIRETQAAGWKAVVCSTGQHRELLDPILAYFGIRPDVDLKVMRNGQSIASLQAACLQSIEQAFHAHRPDAVFAVGDTTSVTSAGLAAFYARIPFVHVEAGLRTGDLQAPWPEELNRRVATLTASLHCTPTKNASSQLIAEGIPTERIAFTGNPVVDALYWTATREEARHAERCEVWKLRPDEQIVLATAHRRENIQQGIRNICLAISKLAERNKQMRVIFPLHKNPQVSDPIKQHLSGIPNVQLCEPLDYPDFVWLLSQAKLVLTDSGGVQEEAVSLQKRVLVLRESTERPEGLTAGFATLVGTNPQHIVETAESILSSQAISGKELTTNPYGDGQAAGRILHAASALLESSKKVAA